MKIYEKPIKRSLTLDIPLELDAQAALPPQSGKSSFTVNIELESQGVADASDVSIVPESLTGKDSVMGLDKLSPDDNTIDRPDLLYFQLNKYQ